jgi:hypothetical protein
LPAQIEQVQDKKKYIFFVQNVDNKYSTVELRETICKSVYFLLTENIQWGEQGIIV